MSLLGIQKLCRINEQHMSELRNKDYQGVGLDDLWPWKPYRKTATVRWVIENFPDYAKWAVGKGFKMNNEAFAFYQQSVEE